MAVSRRLGQSGIGVEGFTLKMDVSKLGIVKMTDAITGAFRGGMFQTALTNVNARAAYAVQEGMVAELDKQVNATRRPQRPGARLENAILDERNREVYANSFTVGRPSWLDKSPAALYWRRIEQGDPNTFAAFVHFTNDFKIFERPYTGIGTGKNMRMPQGQGVLVHGIGPFPKYEFSRGGQAIFRSYPYKAEYRKALKDVGLTLS